GKAAATRDAGRRARLNRTAAKGSTKKTRRPDAVSFDRATPRAPAKRPEPAAEPTVVAASTAPPVPTRAAEAPPVSADSTSKAPTISVAKVRSVPVAPMADHQHEPVLVQASAGRVAPRRTSGALALGRKPTTIQTPAEALQT